MAAKMVSKPAEVDMTAMIDMTFQLLAFFMVLINFTEADVNERIKLPISELAKPPEKPHEKPVTLQVTDKGLVLLAGQEVEIKDLSPHLQRERDAIVAADMNPGDAVIIIRAHLAAKTGNVQDVIQECQKARFEKFALRASEKQ